MANPIYTSDDDGIATLTANSLADIKKLSVKREGSGYAVYFSDGDEDQLFQTLPADTKKVRFELKVGDLISTQAEIDLGLNIGQVDKADTNASKDTAQTSWGALLKDQFHFVWVNGTPGDDNFNFQTSPDVLGATRDLMNLYERGIWLDLKTGDDTVVGSGFGDNFNLAGEGLRLIDGGFNEGSPPWGGRATDSVDVFISSTDTVSVEFTTERGYTHELLINGEKRALLKGIENVNIQIWNDLDQNGERDWGTEVQWMRNIQLAIQVNEVRLDPNDDTQTDWGHKLEDVGHLAWINGTKGDDEINAAELVSEFNQGLQDTYSHGVWIDGAEGDDTITGTVYSDNIKGGAGVDKIDGGTHTAAVGRHGQDVFEIELVAADTESAQALLNTVRISLSDDEDYTWMVTVGTGDAVQTDYIRNIEVVSVTVRDADNNWLTGKWVNTALNVGEIRLDKDDPSQTEWGSPVADQHHFAWVNGTSADEAFDYTGANTAADTVSDPTKALMNEHERGMWVDTGAGNDTIVTSPYSDRIVVSGDGTKWVDAGENLGKTPWGEKGFDEVEVFVAPGTDPNDIRVVLLTEQSTGDDETAFDNEYIYKVQVGDQPAMAYLKGVERVSIQIWEDKNTDGQRQWFPVDEFGIDHPDNEMTWVKQVPLAVQVNEIRVSASKNDETEWGQKLTEMYHMAWINGTDQSDTIDAPSLLSDATKALQGQYARGISIDAGAGDDNITATGYADNIRGGWGNDVVRGGLQTAPVGERVQDVYDIQLWANNLEDAKHLLQRVKVLPVTPADNQPGFEWKVISPGPSGEDEVDYLHGIEVVNVYINEPINNQWLAGRWQPIALNVGEIRIDRTDPTKTEWGSQLSEQYHYAWVNGTNVPEKFDFEGSMIGAETVTPATKALMLRDQRGLWVDMAGGDDEIRTSPYGDNMAISGPGVRWIDGGDQGGIDPWGNAPKDHLDVYVKSQADAEAVELLALDAVKDKDALAKGYTAKVVLRDEVLAYLKNVEVVNVQIWTDQNDDDLRQWDQDQFQWFGRLTVDVHEVRISATDPSKTEWNTPLSEQWHFAWINGTEQGETINATDLVSGGTAALQATHKRGLWVNAGDGDDTITGTDYSDDVDGGPGNDLADGGGQTAPVGEQGRDTYQVRIEIESGTIDPQTALASLSVSRVTTQDPQAPGFGYQWQIAYGEPGDPDYQVDFVRNFESLSVSVHVKDSGQWLAGYWKHLALTVGEIRLDKNNPQKTEWGADVADQHHLAWVNGVGEDEVFDYNTQISAATKALMLQHGRGLWVETRGGNDVIKGSPYGDNFNIVAWDQGVQKIDGGAQGGAPLWGRPPADHLDVFVATRAEAQQVRVVPLSIESDGVAVSEGYSLKAIVDDGDTERTLAYLKDIERIGIQIWDDKNNDDQRDWGAEVEGVAGYDLVVSIGYPNNRDTSTGTVWVNGTPAAETIDVQALINTLPTNADPAKNWRGTRLEVNINADQGDGGDTIIGSNNPDMITPGKGVNYISGGAQIGNQTWNKFQATYDSLQLFSGHEGALWKSRKITELKAPQADSDQSLDADAYRDGYKFKVDMSDPYSPEEQEIHYIQGVEQIAFKVRNDLDGNGSIDWQNEVFNQSFVNLETPDVSWTRGEKGSSTVPPAHFFISGSDFIKEVNAKALIDQFIAARKAFPVSPTDLPANFELSSIANESNSFGTFMMLGGGDHRVTGTDFTDTVLLDPSGNSTVDGGGDVGYWKFAGTATGAQDTLRVVDRVDFTAALLPYDLVRLSQDSIVTRAFSNNMTPSNTGDDASNSAYRISASDLDEQPAVVMVKPKSDRTNLPTNIQDLVSNVETATDLTALNAALVALSAVADLNYGLFLGVANFSGAQKYSSIAVLDRVADPGEKLVLGPATVNPMSDLLASSRYKAGNYHLIKLSDWDGFGERPLSELTDADASFLSDVFPKNSPSTEADIKRDLQAIAAYARNEDIKENDFEFALVSYQYNYAEDISVTDKFTSVAGVTLLKDVESLQIRLWADGNFDYRPSGSEVSTSGPNGSLGVFTLKPNAYIVKPEDLGANTGAGKNYGGSLAGTGMAETLDLKKDYQSMLPPEYQAQKLGFKVSDLGGADTVIGTDFDDFFALSAHDDQIEGGAGSDRVAFWWKPSASDGAASLKTVRVPGTNEADPYVQIVQTQKGVDTELARITQTDIGWTIDHKDQTFAKGFGSNTYFGKDVLTGVEEVVVLLEASLKNTSTGLIAITTNGVTDTVPFVVKLSPIVDDPQGAVSTGINSTNVSLTGLPNAPATVGNLMVDLI